MNARLSYGMVLLLSTGFMISCGDDDGEPGGPSGPSNQAPTKAVLTTPANDANDVEPADVALVWQQATDPDGDPVSYDVYLDGDNPPTTVVASGLGATTYTLGDTLDFGTPYYWTVIAKDGNGGDRESDVSSFTTREETPEEKLAGFWTGKYGGGTDAPTTGYAFLFREDGTVRVFDSADTTALMDSQKAEGTYSVSDSIVNTTYTYIEIDLTYSTEATLSTDFDFMEGTWGSGTSTTGGGTFYIQKEGAGS